jgi:oligopeptide transport system permease protein
MKLFPYKENKQENKPLKNQGRPVGYFQDAWMRFRRNKVAMCALILLLGIMAMVIFVPLVSSENPTDTADLSLRNLPPGKVNIFGTDSLGRDLFVRVCVGGRVSIAIGITGALLVIVFGSLWGGIAALSGPKVDNLMMRIVDILSSIPNILLVIFISVVIDSKSIATLLFALTITGWCPTARIVRAQMLQISKSDYVLAAKLMNVSNFKIITGHLIPNSLGTIIVDMTFRIPGFIFSEAFLSYVGLGVQPPQTSWGALCSQSQTMYQFYPWQLIFPASMIALTMLAFTLVGDGLRDAFDPKFRR